MTPTDEAHFIALWQQGARLQEIAQQLDIPLGTVKSRAHALQRQGKIQPRPRGGQRALPTAVHQGTPEYTTSTSAAAYHGTPEHTSPRPHRGTPGCAATQRGRRAPTIAPA